MSSPRGTDCPAPKKDPPKGKPKKKKKGKKRPPRRQYRRREWEDGGGIDDRGRPNPVPDPELATPEPCRIRPGPAKVEVLRRRHEARAKLWAPDEPRVRPDLVKQLVSLGQFMRWAVLSGRRRTKFAHAILPVPGPAPGDPPRFRVEVSRPPQPGRRDREHVGYAATEGEAKALLLDWCERQGIDGVDVEPPEWLRECLKDALVLQGQYGGS